MIFIQCLRTKFVGDSDDDDTGEEVAAKYQLNVLPRNQRYRGSQASDVGVVCNSTTYEIEFPM
jgi:hypothetical protein